MAHNTQPTTGGRAQGSPPDLFRAPVHSGPPPKINEIQKVVFLELVRATLKKWSSTPPLDEEMDCREYSNNGQILGAYFLHPSNPTWRRAPPPPAPGKY